MVGLARSDNGRARNAAAVFFVQSDDRRAPEEPRVLLKDPAATVRSRALRFYASKIHPARSGDRLLRIYEAAGTVPDDVEAIVPFVGDDNVKVQMDAIAILSVYAHLGVWRSVETLRQTLDDPHHKVRHAAARALDVPCPGCSGSDTWLATLSWFLEEPGW